MYFNLLLSIILFSATANAASFNCDQASTKVEKLICSNTQISKLDEYLSSVYEEALSKDHDTQQLKNEQRAWIKKRNKCMDSECLINKYEIRILELRAKCWPEGSAMHTGIKFKIEEKNMMIKVHAKYKELVALVSIKKMVNDKEYLAEERLVKAVKAQQTAWEDYKYKECELIGVLSWGSSPWQSTRSVECASNLTAQRYKRLRDAVNCINKIPLEKRELNMQRCLYQIAPLAVPLEK